MKVVLSPNPYRDRGLRAAQAAEKILRNVGVETAMCLPFLLEGSNLEFPKHIQFKDTQEELKNADMLVCFGGDGTILHAAKDANAHKVPILGVNLGSVGFMAELEQSELSMLSKLAAGKYTIESRMMLDVAVRRDGKVLSSFVQCTEVDFYPLTERQIQRYLATKEPFDKAGAYGIQGKGGLFVRGIRGDYFNVVGFPLARAAQELEQLFGADKGPD